MGSYKKVVGVGCFLLCLFFVLSSESVKAQGDTDVALRRTSDMVAQTLWKLAIWGNTRSHVELDRLRIDVLPPLLHTEASRFVKTYLILEAQQKEASQEPPEYPSDGYWIAEVMRQQDLRRSWAIEALLPGTASEAAAYLVESPGCYEWEGMADCPLMEAQFAETYLENSPETPLKPYLLLVLMHRYRAVTECRDVVHDPVARHAAIQKYRHYLYEVRECHNPFIIYLSNAMNLAPFV